MYYFYILKSLKNKKLYLGSTNDLRKRIKEHNSSLSKATKPYIPWKLIYYEAYNSEKEARHREHNLKLRANAWNQLKIRIKVSLDSN